MAMQTIFRTKQSKNYTVLSNELINAVERGLDLGAAALLSYLLSKPKDWVISTRTLSRQLKNSLSKIRRLLRHLCEAGYVIMNRLTSGHVDWFVYDTPQNIVIKPEDNTVEVLIEAVVAVNTPTDSVLVELHAESAPELETEPESPPELEALAEIKIEPETKTKIEPEFNAVQPEKVINEKLVLPAVFTGAEQQRVKTIIADAPLDLQQSILGVLSTNLKKGDIKMPIAYLKALVNRANAGIFEKPLPIIQPILSVSHIPFAEQVDNTPKMTNLEHFMDLYQRYGEKAVPKAYLAEVLDNINAESSTG